MPWHLHLTVHSFKNTIQKYHTFDLRTEHVLTTYSFPYTKKKFLIGFHFYLSILSFLSALVASFQLYIKLLSNRVHYDDLENSP